MRGSTRPQIKAVAAGRIAPNASPSTGTIAIRGVWDIIFHPDDIAEPGARFGQRLLDVAKGLARLLRRIIHNGHLRVVESGCAGDKDPVAVDYRAAVACLCLKTRSGGDQAAHVTPSH